MWIVLLIILIYLIPEIIEVFISLWIERDDDDEDTR